jgi:hypothetical protein
MSKYDSEYYIAFRPKGDKRVVLKPDSQTASRKYHYKKIDTNSGPLIFLNGFRDEDKNRFSPSDLMVDSSGILMIDALRSFVSSLPIYGMQIHPAIYIDDHDTYHEDYWYLGFHKESDFLDPSHSVIKSFDYPIDDDDEDDYLEVKKYSLDGEKLDAAPENTRLIFKMGGCSKSYLFFHEKVVHYISQRQLSGIQFIKVADFKEGDQF